ncbi:MAG: hypothetical protein K8W52_38740 [Deltaproteobacteria bacterium]|nr:hypothetical protein [Deltaproteobacteria bacterium]
MRTNLSFFASLLLVAATACGTTTRFIATNPSPQPLVAKPASAVQVYTTGVPELPYVEVGIIQGRQSSELSFDEMPKIISAMRADAGKAGCDALLINGASDKVVGDHHSTTTLEGFWGTCIVFVPAGSPGATTAGR